jgi:hypothetical protein
VSSAISSLVYSGSLLAMYQYCVMLYLLGFRYLDGTVEQQLFDVVPDGARRVPEFS